jgi:hypothetical protein
MTMLAPSKVIATVTFFIATLLFAAEAKAGLKA